MYACCVWPEGRRRCPAQAAAARAVRAVVRRLKHYKFLRAAGRAKAVKQALRFIQLMPRQVRARLRQKRTVQLNGQKEVKG